MRMVIHASVSAYNAEYPSTYLLQNREENIKWCTVTLDVKTCKNCSALADQWRFSVQTGDKILLFWTICPVPRGFCVRLYVSHWLWHASLCAQKKGTVIEWSKQPSPENYSSLIFEDAAVVGQVFIGTDNEVLIDTFQDRHGKNCCQWE